MRRQMLLLGVLLAVRGLACAGTAIDLLPQAEVRNAVVTLGQVARLQSSDLALIRKLVDLPVGRSPRAGTETTLRRVDVERWLRQAVTDPQDVVWRGAQEVRLRRVHTVVSGDSIAITAADALRYGLTATGLRGDIKVGAMPRDVHVEGGDIRLFPRPVVMNRLGRRTIVWVELWSAGAFVRSVPVAFEVQYVASPSARQVASTPYSDPRLAGLTVMQAPEREAPVVGRGEWAALRNTLGSVVLESRVQVLQDGRPGERIRVRQQGATGVVFARVMAAGLLELAP